jgi:hypothetical protein
MDDTTAWLQSNSPRDFHANAGFVKQANSPHRCEQLLACSDASAAITQIASGAFEQHHIPADRSQQMCREQAADGSPNDKSALFGEGACHCRAVSSYEYRVERTKNFGTLLYSFECTAGYVGGCMRP